MIKKPYFKLLYNSKDITRDFRPFVNSIRYTDRTTGESDDVEIICNDIDGLFLSDWYPKKGAKLTVSLGYEDDNFVCGEFELDEICLELSPVGDTISMRAISAVISSPFRTKSSKAYEKITLEKLATTIAAIGKLGVKGNIENIYIDRITQNNETPLGFLHRIAGTYGYTFIVKPGSLIFTKSHELQEKGAKLNLGETDIRLFRQIDGTERTFIESDQRYYDRSKKKVISYFAKKKGEANPKKDRFIGIQRAENEQQAELMARAALLKSENNTVRADLTTHTGITSLRAGLNMDISDLGVISGKWHIESSTHYYSPDTGYQTEAEIFKV